jgi:hypothetical protein
MGATVAAASEFFARKELQSGNASWLAGWMLELRIVVGGWQLDLPGGLAPSTWAAACP